MSFSYDRINSTPQKKNQSALGKVQNVIQRKLLSKVLDFVNKL